MDTHAIPGAIETFAVMGGGLVALAWAMGWARARQRTVDAIPAEARKWHQHPFVSAGRRWSEHCARYRREMERKYGPLPSSPPQDFATWQREWDELEAEDDAVRPVRFR